jgi:hypothetical protein
MKPEYLQNWIQVFFGAHRVIKQQGKSQKSSKITKTYKNLTVNQQTLSLFHRIIFETVWNIGNACRQNHIYKFNVHVNHYHILKGFIELKALSKSVWIFKFRKYFSKFHLRQKNI